MPKWDCGGPVGMWSSRGADRAQSRGVACAGSAPELVLARDPAVGQSRFHPSVLGPQLCPGPKQPVIIPGPGRGPLLTSLADLSGSDLGSRLELAPVSWVGGEPELATHHSGYGEAGMEAAVYTPSGWPWDARWAKSA